MQIDVQKMYQDAADYLEVLEDQFADSQADFYMEAGGLDRLELAVGRRRLATERKKVDALAKRVRILWHATKDLS